MNNAFKTGVSLSSHKTTHSTYGTDITYDLTILTQLIILTFFTIY